MRRRLSYTAMVLVFLAGGFFVGQWLVGQAGSDDGGAAAEPPARQQEGFPRMAVAGGGEAAAKKRAGAAEDDADDQGETVIRFADEQAYRAFLANLEGSGVVLLGQLDALRAVRVGFGRSSDLAALLGEGGGEIVANFPVLVPDPGGGGVQAGAVGMGASLLEWLGIEGDHSQWGKGVLVAVLDTGIADHPTLSGSILRLDAVALPGDLSLLHGHGTAVASLIAGSHPLAPGVAPGASLLSVRIANESGMSDSFSLAAGIIAAVDAGAQVINISMGSYGNASIVYDAVRYAMERGSVIVASSGNDAAGSPLYPAAYPGVISVGAVDKRGEHLAFSNQGAQLAIAAPGYQVNSAWPNEQLIGFTGTSASAPIISGAIAATMSSGGGVRLSAQQAVQIVMANSNDAGAPGADSYYGGGLIDMGRVTRRDEAGVVDAAVAGVVLSADGGSFLVTVQNRGTTTLVNTAVEVTTAAGSAPMNITSLAPGAIHTFSVPVGNSSNTATSITTRVTPTAVDAFPANNLRTDVLEGP